MENKENDRRKIYGSENIKDESSKGEAFGSVREEE